MPRIEQDASAREFLKSAGPMLYRDEPVNSLMIGLVEGISDLDPQPLLLRLVENGRVVTAAIQSRPENIVITTAESAQLDLLTDFLKQKKIFFQGVVGPARETEIFANLWCEKNLCTHETGMAQQIYRADEILVPQNVKGSMVRGTLSDLPLVAEWLHEFSVESIPHEVKAAEQLTEFCEKKIKQGFVFFWEVDGKKVSVAHLTRPTQNGISVAAVYTPPSLRKRGYASVLVAHMSKKALNKGKKFCVLYTNLANPTSNKIYQAIGYYPVAESKLILFKR